MAKKIDQNTRYFIDVDLKARTIIGWDYDQRDRLAQELPQPFQHRVFITKGQYQKMLKKALPPFQ